MWLLVPTAARGFLRSFGAVRRRDWPEGIFFVPPAQNAAFVVIHRLPRTPETMLLRLFGRGRVQQEAIQELLALPESHGFRNDVVELLFRWRIMLEELPALEADEREDFMNLSQAYQNRIEKYLQQGLEQGLEQGRQQGELIGRIQVLQRILQHPITPKEELLARTLEELEADAKALEHRIQ